MKDCIKLLNVVLHPTVKPREKTAIVKFMLLDENTERTSKLTVHVDKTGYFDLKCQREKVDNRKYIKKIFPEIRSTIECQLSRLM